jgi:NAD(P)-dependent dehydrogenase (short-subunit alcohol dehydrogenase family)
VRKLLDFAEVTFGGVAVLVNNASAPFHGDARLDYWLETVETDFLGTMYGIRAAIDAMRRTGGGAIVNIARFRRCGTVANIRRRRTMPPRRESSG